VKTPVLALVIACAAASPASLDEATGRSRAGVGPQATDPIPWSATRKLDWRDFRAKAPGELTGARSVLSYRYSIGCRDQQLHATITAFFLPDQSWVAYRIISSGLASPVGLRHEQTHFDLKELYARRVRKMFAELATPCPRSDDELFAMAERILREEGATQRRFEDETRNGENERRQIEWEKRVAGELDALKGFAAESSNHEGRSRV